MRADTEAAWLEGLDSRTEQDRRDEAWGIDPTPAATTAPTTEPPF